MDFVQAVVKNLINHFENQEISPSLIIAVLLVVTALAFYEFIVYHVVLHRSLYNKAFNISITVMPFFIATIILCLQSNLIITLGTIGALAIIRFRTAVKDPVDMIFILWAIHIGITCGCQLYELAVMTSLAVTVVLVILNHVSFGSKSHVLVIHCKSMEYEQELFDKLKEFTKKYRVKSRNYTDKGVDFVFEIITKQAGVLATAMEQMPCVERFSFMEYDPDDII